MNQLEVESVVERLLQRQDCFGNDAVALRQTIWTTS